jgi:hypothetical protein
MGEGSVWRRLSYHPASTVDGVSRDRIGKDQVMTARRRTAVWAAGVALGIVILFVSIDFLLQQGRDPVAWLATVLTLVAAIPLPFVIVACLFKAAEVALNAGAWTTVLRAAYPGRRFTFRETLGVVQGGIAMLALIPPKFGGVALLGLYRAAFPDLGVTAVVAARVVQGISSTVLGTVLLLVFAAANAGFGEQPGLLDAAGAFYAERPRLATLLTVVVAALLVVAVRRGRAVAREIAAQMVLSGAILRSPRRYVLLVVLPTLLAFALRWAVTGTLLAAFGIPLSLETLLRVNVSHGLARTVQVTPGGLGTTQAFDLVALGGVAPVDVIMAYSLAQTAVLLVFNLAFGLVTLVWAIGWERTARLLRFQGGRATPGPVAAPQPSAG